MALRDVKERVTYCSVCNNITDTDPCAFCSSEARDPHTICVVEEPQNVSAIEKTREFKGVYHVLMGALSPLQGIGPDELKIKSLLTVNTSPIAQAVIGSSANPGLRDFAIVAAMVAGRQTCPGVSFDINPTSREILADLTKMGAVTDLVVGGG